MARTFMLPRPVVEAIRVLNTARNRDDTYRYELAWDTLVEYGLDPRQFTGRKGRAKRRTLSNPTRRGRRR